MIERSALNRKTVVWFHPLQLYTMIMLFDDKNLMNSWIIWLILFSIPVISLLYIFAVAEKDTKGDMAMEYTFKFITLCSLFSSLFFEVVIWKIFPIYNLDSQELIYPRTYNSFFELNHTLNLPFLILSTFILIIVLLTSWYSQIDLTLYCSLILVTELCLLGAFSTTSIFIFLLLFELSALPIFILITYSGSPRRERIKASYYFMFFTLYGSISILLLILNTYSLLNIDFINNQESTNELVAWILLFIGFGVKIPLFPFHIWLPYAHVEASTSVSIVLAALMLKLGGFGLIKYMLPLFTVETHLFFRPFAIVICVIGALYGGIVAIRQIDLKRQIAFSSISHMSFATLGIFTFTEVGIKGAVYLMLSHGLTSSALFYLVGVLSERHHTRSILAFSGLFGVMPVFSFFLLIASLANVGFPGTSGFIPEFLILVAILSTIPSLLPILLLGMLAVTAATLISLLRLLFGNPKVIYTTSAWLDLTKIELFILTILSFWIIFAGFYDILPNFDYYYESEAYQVITIDGVPIDEYYLYM